MHVKFDANCSLCHMKDSSSRQRELFGASFSLRWGLPHVDVESR